MRNEPYPERKRIRLNRSAYTDLGTACSITACTLNRAPIFQDRALAEACLGLLASLANTTGVVVHAYCFMPDHIHLLITPSETTSTVDFVASFKDLSTRLAWQHGYRGRIWQARYYDHFLRHEEDLDVAVNYILNNPVRKGLAPGPGEYRFAGSLAYSL